jgi:hypothetical protein
MPRLARQSREHQTGNARPQSGSLPIVKRAFLSVVAAAVGLTVLSACATVEPDAATVGSHHIRIREFEKRLGKLSKLSILQSQVGPGRISTSMAQVLLAFELDTRLLGDEIADKGVVLTPEEVTAATDVAKQQVIGNEADWELLDSTMQNTFTQFVARRTKLRQTTADGATDDVLRSFSAKNGDLIAATIGVDPNADQASFDGAKPQLKLLYGAEVVENALVARAQWVKVDPRYGPYYASTHSFLSPEERATQAAANGG